MDTTTVTTNIHISNGTVICPGQMKYATTIDAKHSGGPGRAGSIVPTIPNMAAMTAMASKMMSIMGMKALLNFFTYFFLPLM